MAETHTGSWDKFDVDRMSRYLRTRYIGRKIEYKLVTESTMDDARRLAETDCPEGVAVLAESQTRGRGQDGHVWESTQRGNIYATFVFWRSKEFQNRIDTQDLEFLGSCAVLRAIHDVGVLNAQLKWKNDVWCFGHKLSGALVETFPPPQSIKRHFSDVICLLGIGVNVNSDVRRHPKLNTATSIRSELCGVIVSREKLFASICNNLEEFINRERLSVFQQMSPYQLIGPRALITVHDFRDHTKLYSAVVQHVNNDWTCLLKDETGDGRIVGDGVSLRPKPRESVFLLTENQSSENPSLIQKTLLSVLDSSLYSVNDISMASLKTGHWTTDGRLLVVISSVEGEQESCRVIQRFLKDGGSLLGIGNGVRLVSQWLSHLCDISAEPLPDMDTGHQIQKIIYHDLSLHERHFYTYCPDLMYQISGVRVEEARTDSGKTVCGSLDVMNGKVALVGFPIDLTYTDIDPKDISTRNFAKLQESIFKRDVFLITLLRTLLQNTHASHPSPLEAT